MGLEPTNPAALDGRGLPISVTRTNFWLKAKLLEESNPCLCLTGSVLSARRNSLPINNSAKFVKDRLLAKVVAATYSNLQDPPLGLLPLHELLFRLNATPRSHGLGSVLSTQDVDLLYSEYLAPGVRFERDEAHERFISLLRLGEINLFDSTMPDPAYSIILTKAWEVEPTSKSSVTSTLSHMPDAIFQTNSGKVDLT